VDKHITGSLQEIQFIWELVHSGELTQTDLEERIGATRSWISKHQDRIEAYGFIRIEVKPSPFTGYPVNHYRITNRRQARAHARRQARQFCERYALNVSVMQHLLEAGRLSADESRSVAKAIDKVLAKR
jgi:DNA-binding MarR family transcriptional regulator